MLMGMLARNCWRRAPPAMLSDWCVDDYSIGERVDTVSKSEGKHRILAISNSKSTHFTWDVAAVYRTA